MILFPLFAPVSLTPVAICYRYQQHQRNRWQIFRRCHWSRWQICHWCLWYWWCTVTCEYLREFFGKIRNDPNVIFGGLGKMIHEKTWSKKSCDTVPLIHLTMVQLKVMLCVQWANAEWGSVYFELKQNYALCTLCLCSSYIVKLSELVMLNK